MRSRTISTSAIKPRLRVRTIAVAVALACAGSGVSALGLGAPEVSSALGQPLQMRVPLAMADGDDLNQLCLRLGRGADGDDIPTLTHARLTLERGPTGPVVGIASFAPVQEPALRVVLEAGCRQRVQREFTLLLDPPAVTHPPAVATAGSPASTLKFGTPQIFGIRGRPLLINVPLYGEAARSLGPDCVRTVQGDTTDTPRRLNEARSSLIQRNNQPTLQINTADAVNDASVRVVVDVGCELPVRREFAVLLEAPGLARTREPALASVAGDSPPRRQPKPVQAQAARPKPSIPVALPPPAIAAAPAQKPASETRPPSSDDSPLLARQTPASTDRLVLRAPEDMPAPPAPQGSANPIAASPVAESSSPLVSETPAPIDAESEVLKRMDALSTEVKRLRSDLDSANARNRELTAKENNAGYAWASAAFAAVMLLGGVILAWRTRRAEDERWSEEKNAGPLTRILGKEHGERNTQMAAPPPSAQPMANFKRDPHPARNTKPAAAAPATTPSAHTGPSTDISAIQVTEFRNTTDAIDQLYASVLDRDRPTEPLTQPSTEIALDVDLYHDRTTLVSQPTRTQLAVDIDLNARPTQAAPGAAPPTGRVESDELDQNTVPADLDMIDRDSAVPTKKLELDLDLDLTTLAQPKRPPDPWKS